MDGAKYEKAFKERIQTHDSQSVASLDEKCKLIEEALLGAAELCKAPEEAKPHEECYLCRAQTIPDNNIQQRDVEAYQTK